MVEHPVPTWGGGSGEKERLETSLKVLQYNCGAGKQAVETLLEIAVERQVDQVLIQEPTTGRGSTARCDSFRWLKGEDREVVKC
jgi:hypothetical protein